MTIKKVIKAIQYISLSKDNLIKIWRLKIDLIVLSCRLFGLPVESLWIFWL